MVCSISMVSKGSVSESGSRDPKRGEFFSESFPNPTWRPEDLNTWISFNTGWGQREIITDKFSHLQMNKYINQFIRILYMPMQLYSPQTHYPLSEFDPQYKK